MITILLNNRMMEVVTRRYNTNSFDEAAIQLVDDWVSGQLSWEDEETNEAFTPEWLEKNGYPQDDCLPEIDEETEIIHYSWFWWNGEDELIIDGYFIKSSPVEPGEWPTMGVS